MWITLSIHVAASGKSALTPSQYILIARSLASETKPVTRSIRATLPELTCWLCSVKLPPTRQIRPSLGSARHTLSETESWLSSEQFGRADRRIKYVCLQPLPRIGVPGRLWRRFRVPARLSCSTPVNYEPFGLSHLYSTGRCGCQADRHAIIERKVARGLGIRIEEARKLIAK